MSRDIFPERGELSFDDIERDVMSDWQAIDATDNEGIAQQGEDPFRKHWDRLDRTDDAEHDRTAPTSVFEEKWYERSYEDLRKPGVANLSPELHTKSGDVELPWRKPKKVDITQPLRPWHER